MNENTTKTQPKPTLFQAVLPLLGLLVCYAFGTAWFMLLYMRTTGPVGLVTVLGWCVFPFVLPDLLKILLAMTITARLRPYVR